MLAGAEEKGTDDDTLRAAFDTAGVRGGDRRLRDLHVGRFDDVEFLLKSLAEEAGDFFEHLIALGATGAVVYDDDADLHRSFR
jgi:hypothetical protein